MNWPTYVFKIILENGEKVHIFGTLYAYIFNSNFYLDNSLEINFTRLQNDQAMVTNETNDGYESTKIEKLRNGQVTK